MELQKRNCGIKIELEPIGANFLGVFFDFYGKEFFFTPSSAVGGQFNDFISALYALYYEDNEGHNGWDSIEYHEEEGTNHIIAATSTVEWDNEGKIMNIEMTKKYDENAHDIFIKITTDYGQTFTELTVNDKDLCYAVAKACTDVLKEFGIYGYRYSTEYDDFHLHKLLFLKAYALDHMEIRELKEIGLHSFAKKTDFNKEIELLLFDM